MLKIVDKDGKQVFEWPDDSEQPIPLTSKEVKVEDKEEKEPKKEEEDAKE